MNINCYAERCAYRGTAWFGVESPGFKLKFFHLLILLP